MIYLCDRAALCEGAARGIEIALATRTLSLLVLDTPTGPRGYLNSCPHVGVRLDWRPDDFFDAGGTVLQGATHGALFDPESGACVARPCRSAALVALQLALRDGQVFLCNAESLPHTARHQRRR
jgi:nitrite reductase/ring-hydroxylating ferredoxin subunit